ncbi:MAG: hypothetical protein QXM52_01290 [Candidatus Bathyarchaeia archaeon]
MRVSLKRFNLALVLALVLALLLAQFPTVYPGELSIQEKVFTFLRDVVRLDMTKYTMKLLGSACLPPSSNPEMYSWVYALKSNESELKVVCNFKDDALVWCNLYPLKGSPIFTQLFTNALDEAKGFLERYQTYAGVSHIQPLRSMLDTVSELTPMTKAVGDVRMEIRIEKDWILIQWMNAVNGITNTYNIVELDFRNGAFELFCDFWNRYKIGSAEVKVGKEEAIRIAKEKALNCIREAVGEEAASSFTFISEYAFLTMQQRGDALYPHWEVLLELNKMVLSQGKAFRVSVWADTGEVPYIAYSGSYGGAPPSNENPPETPPTVPSPDNTADKTSPSLDPTIILIAIPIILATTIGITYHRKRKH